MRLGSLREAEKKRIFYFRGRLVNDCLRCFVHWANVVFDFYFLRPKFDSSSQNLYKNQKNGFAMPFRIEQAKKMYKQFEYFFISI